MSNPTADFPTILHQAADASAFPGQYLGATAPTHSDVHGKIESELVALGTKLGTGASSPVAGTYLKATGSGSSAWAAIDFLQIANNLSDVANVATARTNLGLGNVDNTSDAGKPVSTAQAAAIALKLSIASNLSDLNSAATARTNLGLVAAGAGDIWVEKAGDTMTGPLIVGTASGVTSPFTVNVPSTATAGIDLRVADNSPFAMRIFNSTFSASASVFSYFPRNTGQMDMGTDGATSLRFYTGGFANVRMSIDSAGNMGVGVAPGATTRLTITPSTTNNTAFLVNESTDIGTGNNLSGLSIDIRLNHTTTAGTLRGFVSQLRVGASASSLSTLSNFYIAEPVNAATTITTAVGVDIEKQKTTNVTTGFGVRQQSTLDVNTFAGNTRLGSTTAPTNALDVTGNVRIGTASSNGFISIGTPDPNTGSAANVVLYIERVMTTASTIFAVNGEITQQSTGSIYGLQYAARANGSGTTALAIGISALGRNTGSGAVTDLRSLEVQANQNSGGGTVTTSYGLTIAAQTVGTNNTNLLIGGGTTGNWSIYNNSANDNAFAGNLTLGGTAAPTAALTMADAKNIAVGTTTGTKIGTVGGSSGQKLGFFNATPIVQPLLATGAAATVDNVITALQNLGLVRQS